MKICAGIVLYNPDIKRLKECVDAVLPQVECLVLVDNASLNINEVENELAGYDIIWIKNERNFGIACALNQLTGYADSNGYEWLLTLDQDSICEGVMVIKLYDAAVSGVAMVAPLVIDRGIPETGDTGGLDIEEPLREIEEVKMCITSGTLTNVATVLEIGGFNEWLFVYDVDREICIRLLRGGYKLLRVNSTRLFHEHGIKTVSKKIFGKQIVYRNYSPISVYYMTRNLVFMLRKYGREYNPNPKLRWIRMYTAFFIKFVFQPDKMSRLRAFRQGVKEGKAVKI